MTGSTSLPSLTHIGHRSLIQATVHSYRPPITHTGHRSFIQATDPSYRPLITHTGHRCSVSYISFHIYNSGSDVFTPLKQSLIWMNTYGSMFAIIVNIVRKYLLTKWAHSQVVSLHMFVINENIVKHVFKHS